MSLPSPAKLTKVIDAEREARAIRDVITPHKEWFLSADDRTPISVTRDDFEFSLAHGRLVFSCWTEEGSRMWRVKGWNWTGEKLRLELTRRMGAETATFELIPQLSAKALVAGIAAARQQQCEKLAHITAAYLSAK